MLYNNISHLVNRVPFCQLVEDGVHGIQHGHHLHRSNPAADLREGDYVREQDGYAIKHLQEKKLMIYYTFGSYLM